MTRGRKHYVPIYNGTSGVVSALFFFPWNFRHSWSPQIKKNGNRRTLEHLASSSHSLWAGRIREVWVSQCPEGKSGENQWQTSFLHSFHALSRSHGYCFILLSRNVFHWFIITVPGVKEYPWSLDDALYNYRDNTLPFIICPRYNDLPWLHECGPRTGKLTAVSQDWKPERPRWRNSLSDRVDSTKPYWELSSMKYSCETCAERCLSSGLAGKYLQVNTCAGNMSMSTPHKEKDIASAHGL